MPGVADKKDGAAWWRISLCAPGYAPGTLGTGGERLVDHMRASSLAAKEIVSRSRAVPVPRAGQIGPLVRFATH